MSHSVEYSTGGAARSAGTDTLNLSTFRGKNVHTYTGFISADGNEIANSIYTGEVVVS